MLLTLPNPGRWLLAYLLCCIVLGAVAPAMANDMFELRFLGDYRLTDKKAGLKEPSGLAFDPMTGRLWTVSDDTERLFQLDGGGDVDDDRSPRVDADELEGITVLSGGDLAAVSEEKNEIVVFDRDGNVQKRRTLDATIIGFDAIADDFSGDGGNKGLEGITVNPATGAIYVLKEGEPRLLLELNGDLSELTDVHRLTSAAGFQVEGVEDEKLDVSGVAYDPTRNGFWIVSDKGSSVFFYDPIARAAVARPLFHRRDGEREALIKAEGVALHRDGKTLFVATDRDEGSKPVLAAYEILSAGQ